MREHLPFTEDVIVGSMICSDAARSAHTTTVCKLDSFFDVDDCKCLFIIFIVVDI